MSWLEQQGPRRPERAYILTPDYFSWLGALEAIQDNQRAVSGLRQTAPPARTVPDCERSDFQHRHPDAQPRGGAASLSGWVRQQTQPMDSLEVIVVMDGTTDDTPSLLAGMEQPTSR